MSLRLVFTDLGSYIFIHTIHREIKQGKRSLLCRWGMGENSSAITTHLSPQRGDYSGASLLRKSLSSPIPVGGRVVDTND